MKNNIPATKPNILLIMVDQMRFPRFGYGPDGGFDDPLKRIFGFQPTEESNEYKQFFPGLWGLRHNAVVLNNHKVASSACVPSRTALFTGQYGSRTGATQTDGVFKSGNAPNFPWLTPGEFPTIGHWMREFGYTTHYFGKWHVSGEATEQLNHYGFSDWNLSYPDPHGALPNNLGYYRDYQFTDVITGFLRRQGLGIPQCVAHAKSNVEEAGGSPTTPAPDPSAPWFAVASFTNPHDIATYPMLPSMVYPKREDGAHFALKVPPQGSHGKITQTGSLAIELNRLGFPQNNAQLPPTWNESLNNKPTCHLDYSYKMGLALASMGGWLAAEKNRELGSYQERLEFAVEATLKTNLMGLPFTITDSPNIACRNFIQYYGYLIHEVDQHINSVLDALNETGQAENTIVLFCADHGECGGAHHMMMEKWHTAYEEVLHVPMVARFPESLYQVPEGLNQISELTNHIDILPTVLGLAGANSTDIQNIKIELEKTHSQVLSPVGADLSKLIYGEEDIVKSPTDGEEREGVMFITYDTITEPLEEETQSSDEYPTQYEVFNAVVDRVKSNPSGGYPNEAELLAPGSVTQPNHLHCVTSKDNWKLVRYFEPVTSDQTAQQQSSEYEYELYDLTSDPCEALNLLVCKDAQFPTAIDGSLLPSGLTPEAVTEKAYELMDLMVKLEAEVLDQI